MKMRCPKCGTSFMVAKDGSTGTTGTHAAAPSIARPPIAAPIAPPPAIGAPPAAAPAAVIAPPFSPKGTMLGHQAPAEPAPQTQASRLRGALGAAPAAQPAEARSPTGSLIPPPGERPSGPMAAKPIPIAPPMPTVGSKSAAAKGAFGATVIGAGPAVHAQAAASATAFARNEDPGLDAGVDLPDDLPPPPKPQPTENADLSVSRMYVDDLPAPKAELDLPRPRFEADLPVPKAGKPAAATAPAKPDPFADLPQAKPAQAAAHAPAARLNAPSAALEPDPSPMAFGDLDLPAPKVAADLPARKTIAQAPAQPARKAGGASFGEIELPGEQPDLPTLKNGADLPAAKTLADLPAPRGTADLPAPRGAADLPAPRGTADLPARKGTADLPQPKGVADLPAPRGVSDLMMPAAHKDLPSPKAGSAGFGDLELPPATKEQAFGDLELPTPKGGPGRAGDESSFADLDLELPDLPLANSAPPARPRGGFGDIELPPPKPAADLVPPKSKTVQGMGAARKAATVEESSFSDLDLDEERDSDLPPSLLEDGEAALEDIPVEPRGRRSAQGAAARPAPRPPSRPVTTELGDDEVEELEPDGQFIEPEFDTEAEPDQGGYGEGEEDWGGEDDASEEEMEFGISGEEGRGGVSLPPEILRRQRGEEFEAKQAALGRRTVTIVVRLAVLLVVLIGAGAALKFTEYGVFGIYFLERYLPEAGDAQLARGAIDKAEKIAASDTYAEVKRGLKELGDARRKAGLNRELLTRSLTHEGLFMVRFGEDANSAAHAAALLKRLEERSFKAPGIELARAADAARRKQWREANELLGAARRQGARDPYVELLAGEIALAENKIEAADKAFSKALALGGDARAQWGIARVALLRTDRDAQIAAVNETLKLSPMHVDARIAEARILWDQGKEERAQHLLRVALGLEPTEDDQHLWSSKGSIADGYSLLGYIHESRGRLHAGRVAYEQALAADPYKVEALLGSGRVLLREKRYNDAQARFESALSAATKGGQNPVVLSGRKADVEAQLGVGRTLLVLDRGQEAKQKLEALSAKLPNDPDIVLALGETEQALGKPVVAEAQFRKSIELAPKRFDGYLALSQLFFKQGDAGKASEVLNEAAAQVEETAEMRRMLGQSELARNKLESAVHEFKRALELDPHAVDAMFGMAIAQRKHGDLDQAEKTLEQIASRDPSFAGLAEQRGLLHEARGEFEKATQSYRDALKKDPEDNSLLLRLGAAQVAASDYDGAEQTLAKVIREMPNSAEAEYFIGRIAFGRGRTPDALAHFDRAVSLDATKGEYHLYVARASLEMGNLGRTLEEALAAINFDPNLGDAYWVRAIVRLRMGAVKDALTDLNKALKLNPGRTEAYAVMGDCYEQLRQTQDALRSYRTALERDPKRGEWWYRVATMLADAGNRGEGDMAVRKAIEIGDKADHMPYYLPDAYRIAGENAESRGDRTGAIRNYKRYREIAPTNAIDRSEIEKKLRGWNVQLDEE